MVSPVLFVGSEDISFVPVNTAIVSTIASAAFGQFGIETGTNACRSGYSRYALAHAGVTSANTTDTSHYIRNFPAFSASSFWATFRINAKCNSSSSEGIGANIPVRLVDSSGVVRLNIKFSAAFLGPNDTFIVNKINAAGTVTQIGSTSTGRFTSFTASTSSYIAVPDKIDIFVNYAVSGQLSVYLNGNPTFNFTGDVTTDSQTSLAGLDLGNAVVVANNGFSSTTAYSEVLVSTQDTRSCPGIVTQVATANGNTHNWDAGTVANSAQNFATPAQLSPQVSGTAGQIQEYQVTPALPSGTYSILSVVQAVQAIVGNSGPTKLDLMVRTGGTDFTSSPDLVPGSAWSTFVTNWDTNPNTSATWLPTDLAASSTSFNFGVKSVT